MNNILDLSSSLDFNNNNVVKGEIEIDDVFELENNIEILVQDKIIEPTREIQTVTVDEDYDQLGTVTVNPIPDEYIIPDGTLDVDANGDVDVTMFKMARVGVYTPPTLQDKEVIPTKEEQIISYDEDYDGLNSVIVNSIPDEYIIPTGTLNINKNGTQNVHNYDNVKVKVESVANIGPKRLYLIKDGIEQTDITGGSAFLDMGLGTGYTSISQGNGYLGLCVAEATRSFTFVNSFDYNKYTKLCVEWAYPKADNYGNYIAPTIGVKISKQPSDASVVKTFLMNGGSIRETKPKTITELDIVDAVEGSKVNIIIGRTGYGSDFPNYPAHIYNLYLESSAINLQDKNIEVVQNGTQIITPDIDYDGLNSVTVNTSAIEDLAEELTNYDSSLITQETSIQDIIAALEGKATAGTPIITDYIKEGLYIHYDGVNNGGVGVHNEILTEWVDLQGHNNSTVGAKSVITENSVRTTGGAGDTTSKIETNTFTISDTWTAEQRITVQSYTNGDNPGDTILTINNGSTITWGNYIKNGMLCCNGYSYDTQVSTLNCRYKTLTLSTTYDGTSYKNYINGELVADVPYSRTKNIPVTIINGPYRYQHSHVTNNSIVDFHSFRFYSRVLSQEELKQNYIRDEQLYPMRFF